MDNNHLLKLLRKGRKLYFSGTGPQTLHLISVCFNHHILHASAEVLVDGYMSPGFECLHQPENQIISYQQYTSNDCELGNRCDNMSRTWWLQWFSGVHTKRLTRHYNISTNTFPTKRMRKWHFFRNHVDVPSFLTVADDLFRIKDKIKHIVENATIKTS